MLCFCQGQEGHDMEYLEKSAAHTDHLFASRHSHRKACPIDYKQPEDLCPSLATIEKVAAAKIALELQYKTMLHDASPREQRRRSFERELVLQERSYAQCYVARKLWYIEESDHTRQTRALKTTSMARSREKSISIPGFEEVRVLGRGSFGTVRLIAKQLEDRSVQCYNSGGFDGNVTAQDNSMPKFYALKVLRKSGMLKNCQEGHVRAERDFLVHAESACSPWIVSLFGAFQDNTSLYLIMEFMVGGDFLGVLLREGVLHEDIAR
ncbi:hypothetical protein AMS68_004268 [Peltaster fructicola]|uniref:non-specific serine/threonine protein kinase n=1 Tax=Peltaster fructicola TaxID=286661 RepID=A0A6H0XVR6_9PEZI|nr:hypothetical protein AMS68_004268 [Peltaster fructicola]